MASRWNLLCPECGNYERDVTCSLFSIPPCTCGSDRTIRYDSARERSTVFPFSTTNIDGKPMVIESLNHLRKVERDYGVVFSAFSKSNINDMDPVAKELPKFRGDDEYVRREYRERYRR